MKLLTRIVNKVIFWLYRIILSLMPVRMAAAIEFRRKFGNWPNVDRPRSFSEKIQWRKIYGDHSTYTRLADKVAVKAHVRSILGDDFLIPTIWEGTTLPNRLPSNWPIPFIIKANHGSGMNQFVRDSQVEWHKIKKRCHKWMRTPYRRYLGERFYSFIERKLLVEPVIADDPMDYKFYVFNGRVEYVHVDTGRFKQHKRCFFDRSWKRLPFSLEYPVEDREIPRPQHLAEMVAAAEKLAADLDFVRIDFYDLPSGPKFGEMTFAPGSGYESFDPPEYDLILGRQWQIREKD